MVDGGLTIVTEHMPDVLSVSLGFWVGTGSVDEPEPIAGASHFLEHLLFKGTAERGAREIAELVDAVGGDLNAFTTKEHTAFYVRLLAESADLGLDILSEIIWGPALRKDELEAERQVIVEEILMHSDEPAEEVHDLFNAAMYPGHPLGRDVLGLEETVRATTRDQVAEFHRKHYRTANVVVTAAGRVEHAAIVEGVVRRLDKAADQIGRDVLLGGARPDRVAPSAPAQRLMVLNRPTEQAHIMIGMPAFERDHPDRQVLNVLDHILGGGMSSRLFQTVREERGLAYNVYSYRSGYQGVGDLAVYAGTAPSQGFRGPEDRYRGTGQDGGQRPDTRRADGGEEPHPGCHRPWARGLGSPDEPPRSVSARPRQGAVARRARCPGCCRHPRGPRPRRQDGPRWAAEPCCARAFR